MTELQPFPPLDVATESALRASIERFGVLVPVVKDQHGRTLDGNHRAKIADELGVEYRIDVREVANGEEAAEIARTLNADRRHLAPEQRREVVAALREQGHSLRAIAGAIGASKSQVDRDVAHVSRKGHLRVIEGGRIHGLDGKRYPRKVKTGSPDGSDRAFANRLPRSRRSSLTRSPHCEA